MLASDITNCSFIGNLARAGNGGVSGPSFVSQVSGVDPGVDNSYGGAIRALVFSPSTPVYVTDSTFRGNQAIGGNNASATGSDIVEVGDAEGGAICSAIATTTIISGCTLDDNAAIGGSGNSASDGQVAHAGDGIGGAINTSYGSDGQGDDIGPTTLTITNSTLSQNTAQGGDDNNGSASLAGFVGGCRRGHCQLSRKHRECQRQHYRQRPGNRRSRQHSRRRRGRFRRSRAGGGVFNYLGNYVSIPAEDGGYGTLSASTVNITDSTISFNQAQGGGGGNAEGGGIANLFGAATTVDDSALAGNQASGNGGDALGGGAYNDATSGLTIKHTLVSLNLANGFHGIGGGVYTTGTFSADPKTLIILNFASTSGDNVGP